MENIAAQLPALKRGFGAIAGLIAFGVNGPFLFERFGFATPVAILAGVLLGAGVGFSLVALVQALGYHEPAWKQRAHTTPPGAHLRPIH
jgi:hypothetical protein